MTTFSRMPTADYNNFWHSQ